MNVIKKQDNISKCNIKVLHVFHVSMPYICGYSIRSDYILHYQQENNITTEVVTSAQQPGGLPVEELIGVRYWRTPPLHGRQIPLIRELRLMSLLRNRIVDAITHFKPNVIHAHSPVLVAGPALSVAKKHGIPFIYEVRDLWENASVDVGKFSADSLFYKIARYVDTRVLLQADAIVTICENLKTELINRIGKPERIFVVGNGVDVEKFNSISDGKEARKRWNLTNKIIISYVGNHLSYEGLYLLILAMEYIIQYKPEAHLVLTCSGGKVEDLKDLVCEKGLESAVTFTGPVPHDQVGEIYGMSDILAYPRLLTRTTALTTPLKPLEALAMGKAVIVSDIPPMHELVQRDLTGFMFRAGDYMDLASRIIKILNNTELAIQVGNNGREWVRKHRRWENIVSGYRGIYESVLEKYNK